MSLISMVTLSASPLDSVSCPHFSLPDKYPLRCPSLQNSVALKLVSTSNDSCSSPQLPYSHPHTTRMVQALGQSALLRFTWPQQLRTQLFHLKTIEASEYTTQVFGGEDERHLLVSLLCAIPCKPTFDRVPWMCDTKSH